MALDDSRSVFSRNLSILMNNNGISRRKLCADLSISYTTLASWLDGSKFPRVERLDALARYFGVTKSSLVDNSNYSSRLKLSRHELCLIQNYRRMVNMQKAVDKLLDIDNE